MLNEQIERMRIAMLGYWNSPTLANNFVRLAAWLATGLLLSTFAGVPGFRVFGHDEIHYYQDILVSLGEDGRWLNFLLDDFLKSIPLRTWALLLMVAFWALFYRLTRSFGFDTAYAALVASTILLAYPFAEQILWPATAMPAVVILLIASLLVKRGVAYPVIYMLTGVLIFGTLQTLYFLVPLFFWGQFLVSGTQAGERRWSLLFSHMCWWVAGSVAGVLVMSFLLWPMTGHFGPQPAAWRLTSPIQDVAGLIRNINYASDAFVVQLERFLRFGGVTWGFIIIVGLAVLVRIRALLALHHAMLLLAAVLLSYFVFSIALAPLIQQRSLVAMATSVMLFMALFPGPSVMGRVFGTLLLLKMGYAFSVSDQTYLRLHETETSHVYEKLQQLIPGQSINYFAIALYGTMNSDSPHASFFNDPSRMHPVFMSLYAKKYLDCRQDSRCDAQVGTGKQLSEMPYGSGRLEFSVDEGNIGIIRYVEHPAGAPESLAIPVSE